RRNDPGRPEICLVFSYHQKFNPDEILEIEAGCKSGELGCADCKVKCSSKINLFMEPILEKRISYENDLDLVKQIIDDGESKAKIVAQATMEQVHSVMKIG
ncbi:MAG: tryptophan--tRNA ligase, partial [Ignavibacteriae bacterium]|nr:tryptophan--tRNA ligase [Ignavibacteriota bacterium]